MKPLSNSEVEQIASLARLQLEGDEAERLRSEMTAILEHMDELEQVDTRGVEPMTHAVPLALRLADDVVGPSLDARTAVEESADHQDGQFRVPHIIQSAGS